MKKKIERDKIGNQKYDGGSNAVEILPNFISEDI